VKLSVQVEDKKKTTQKFLRDIFLCYGLFMNIV
jgi:hypothetical protein